MEIKNLKGTDGYGDEDHWYGYELYTLERWKELCSLGVFNDWDGTSYFAIGNVWSSLHEAKPSQYEQPVPNNIPEFTHVVRLSK
jgi:hypothetical protein